MKKVLLLILLVAGVVAAQTPQTPSIPYLGRRALATPEVSGITCSLKGQKYYNTTASKYRVCTAIGTPGTWADEGGTSGISGSTGATDNAVLRADGTGGATMQSSLVSIDDTGNLTIPNAKALILEAGNGTQIGSDGSGTIGISGSFNNILNLHNNYGFSVRTDVGLEQAAAKVLRVTGGKTSNNGTLEGWIQTAGAVRLGSDATNATATMSNLSGLSTNVQAGRKYTGVYRIVALNSTAAEGVQFDFNGGSATVTSIQFYFVSTPPGVTLGTVNSAAIGTALTATTATTAGRVYEIYFDVVINAAGTLIPRFSEVSHTSGTATVKAGSSVFLGDMP